MRPLGHLVARVAGDDVGQGALAGAVRPHQRVDLALVDRQVDALEDLLAVDRGVQILDLEHRRRADPVTLAHCACYLPCWAPRPSVDWQLPSRLSSRHRPVIAAPRDSDDRSRALAPRADARQRRCGGW